MVIDIKQNPLNKTVTYSFITIDKDEENKNWYNADDQNKQDFLWPAVVITFLDKDCDKEDAYIEYIAKNEKQSLHSGTNSVKLAIRLCKYLNVRYAYLQDASKIQCETHRDLSLSLFKLLTTGNTWYEKHGFKFNIKGYKEIKEAIEKVQRIKINDVVKTVKTIRNALHNTINSGDYKQFKLWSPLSSGMAIHRSKWLSNQYENYANIYLLLKKNKIRGDTIKSYSERVIKKSCKDYIETIQNLLFRYREFNASENMLIINYKDKWINYPSVKEIYLINLLVNNYKIKYKKKIR